MKIKRITFCNPREVTNPGEDSRSFLYHFSCVDAAVVGAPEEARVTTEHRLIVTIANNRLPAWKLTDADLIKVLFEIGRRKVIEKVKEGSLQQEERVMVNTGTHSAICPFDPTCIKEPDGAVFEVTEKGRIGFK